MRNSCLFPLLACMALCLSATPLFAVSLTVTPSSMENTFTGLTTLTVTGLTVGQTVTIEEYLDVNGNGVYDTADKRQLSFKVTDGQAVMIGSVRADNIAGDEDGAANGQLTVSYDKPTSGCTAAKYVYVVSNTAGITIASAPFTVTQHVFGQTITGKVTDHNGVAVPNASVGAIDTKVTSSWEIAALTDASGNYTLNCPLGVFLMSVTKAGYTQEGGWELQPPVILGPGASATRNLKLLPVDRHITGRVTDAVTGVGLSGIQVMSYSDIGHGGSAFSTVSDRLGNFDIVVSPGVWNLLVTGGSINQQGYLDMQTPMVANAFAANVTGVAIKLTKGANLGAVQGVVNGSDSALLSGVRVYTYGTRLGYESVTNASGHYAHAAMPGLVMVMPDSATLHAKGYAYLGSFQHMPIVANQVATANFTAQKLTTHLRGIVQTGITAAVPVPGVLVSVSGYGQLATGTPYQYTTSTRTAADGSFDFALLGGTYTVSVNFEDAAIRGLFDTLQRPSVVLVNGQDQNGYTITLTGPTRHLRGTAIDSAQAVVANFPLEIGADPQFMKSFTVWTNADGSFDIPVTAAPWYMKADEHAARERELFGSVSTLNATAGDVNNFVYLLKKASAHITGWVKDAPGNLLVSAEVSATALIDTKSYSVVTHTNGAGQYRLPVIAGTWSITANYAVGERYYSFPTVSKAITTVDQVVNLQAFPFYTPDMMVRNSADTTYLGDNIYYDEQSQKATQNACVGVPYIYAFKVQNDGDTAAEYSITAPTAIPGWTAKYYDGLAGSTEITAAITGDDGWIVTLAPKAVREFRVVVTVNNTVANTDMLYLAVTAASTADSSQSDTAVASTIKMAMSGVNLIGTPTSPVVTGKAVALTAVPIGGAAPRYWFRYKLSTAATWIDLQAYSTSRTCTWVAPAAGTYMVEVLIKEATSTKLYDFYKVLSYVVKPPMSGVALAGAPVSPIVSGTSVKLTATPTGGAKVQYQFRVQPVGGTWTLLQAFSTVATCYWKPLTAGTYTLEVQAKETGSANPYDSLTTITYLVKKPVSAIDLTATPAQACFMGGTPVHLVATATDGNQLQYLFRTLRNGVWTTIQPYGTSNTCDWAPTASGSYSVQVQVKEATSSAAYDLVKTIGYVVYPAK